MAFIRITCGSFRMVYVEVLWPIAGGCYCFLVKMLVLMVLIITGPVHTVVTRPVHDTIVFCFTIFCFCLQICVVSVGRLRSATQENVCVGESPELYKRVD